MTRESLNTIKRIERVDFQPAWRSGDVTSSNVFIFYLILNETAGRLSESRWLVDRHFS